MRIGISGKMASGKTTAANHLVDNYGFKKDSFASPMKALELMHATVPKTRWVDEIWPMSLELARATGRRDRAWEIASILLDVFYAHEPRPGEKNRAFLQQIGTEAGRRKIDDQIWIKYLLHMNKDTDNLVVDDVRFENEAVALKEAGFYLIRIEVSETTQMKRLKELYGEDNLGQVNHTSEVDLDDKYHLFDRVINNDGSLKSLLREVDRAYNEWRKLNE